MNGFLDLGIPSVAVAKKVESAGSWSVAKIALCIYIVGMVVALCHTAFGFIKLISIISSGTMIEKSDYNIVLIQDSGIAPFSWRRYIVMDKADFSSSGDMIILHESRHLMLRHWLDIALAELVCVVQWFNPVAWLMSDELRTVHEFQADRAVLESGVDTREYQLLLIKKAVGSRLPSLANSLNHSNLKKRITMMFKSSPSGWRRLSRIAALVPALAVAFVALQQAPIAQAINSAAVVEFNSTDKVTENPAETGAKGCSTI